MSWPVRMVPAPVTSDDYAALRAGDAFECAPADRPLFQNIAPEHAGKRAVLVKLPCGTLFNIYGTTWSQGRAGPSGWSVSGTAPSVTLSPSVNIGGGWHGYIRDGVISDDVSGRTFP